jgi:putative FmdB family regulatory protein
MPIYEYVCKKCRENFSLFQRLGSTEMDTYCPKCGSREVKKIPSSFSCSSTNDSGPVPKGLYSGFSGGG